MSRLPIAQPISRPSTNGSVHINMKEIERQRQAAIDADDLLDDIDSDDSGSDDDRPSPSPSPSRHDPFTELSSSISQRIVVASKCLVISSKIIKQLQTTQSRNIHHMTTQEQQDDTHIQQSLRDSVTEAHTVIEQMESLMLQFQQLPLEGTKQQQADRRLQRSRLVKDYTDVTKKAKQISTLAKQLTTINLNGNGKQSREVDEDSETTSLLATNSYQQSQMMDDDVHLTEQELAEQEEQARRKHQFMLDIERDVVHVHEMFRDLNGLVHTQQSAIDSIEAGIMETKVKTRMGMDQLLQAEQHMKAKRKNTCCLMLLGVLVVLIVVLFFWVVFG